MTILTLNRKELEKRIGKVTRDIEEKITEMGTPVEAVTDKEVSVEIFPNRPDLLSLENFSRAFNQFNRKGKIAQFKITSSKEKLVVAKSTPKEWPYAVACIIKGIAFDDEKIKSVIDIQEKLHGSILRKRKKGGIGIYPLDKISFPIRFEGRTSKQIRFRPLESNKELDAEQILALHQTGITYAHICEGWEKFPVFVDGQDTIMSMPPIINSHEVGRVSETTRDIFVEATGNNLHAVVKAFNIFVASLAEMGGKIHSIECVQRDGKKITAPDMTPEKMAFKIGDIEKTLGISLTEKQVREYLGRMGIGYLANRREQYALVPAYRTDILHWIDLVEEIAIAHGYDNFEPEIPGIATIAEENTLEKRKRRIADILAGAGLIEASTYHIDARKNIKKMHFDFKDYIEIEDSKTERDVLRIDLLTNLLHILFENSDSAYPQKIFELGTVFSRDDASDSETGVLEKERLAIALTDDEARFTDLKQILDYLCKMLDVSYKIEPVEDANYILGRVGKIVIGGREVGRIGEIAPRVLKNWRIKAPVVALEMSVAGLF